jgi:hypothetical protein
MENHSEPKSFDLSYQLPRDTYYQLIHTLRAALPDPITDSAEDIIRRDNAAMAQIACLLPANADEANLAAQYVAAQAQAFDYLRLARRTGMDTALILKCTAQSACMMRHAAGARRLLMRVQAERQKREADSVARDQAAWIEHCTIGLMADGLGRTPPAPMEELPPARSAPEPEHTDTFSELGEAEQYAMIYPGRAALIRSLGGLPAKCDFGPPEPELVRAIVTGTSPTLRALDAGAA